MKNNRVVDWHFEFRKHCIKKDLLLEFGSADAIFLGTKVATLSGKVTNSDGSLLLAHSVLSSLDVEGAPKYTFPERGSFPRHDEATIQWTDGDRNFNLSKFHHWFPFWAGSNGQFPIHEIKIQENESGVPRFNCIIQQPYIPLKTNINHDERIIEALADQPSPIYRFDFSDFKCTIKSQWISDDEKFWELEFEPLNIDLAALRYKAEAFLAALSFASGTWVEMYCHSEYSSNSVTTTLLPHPESNGVLFSILYAGFNLSDSAPGCIESAANFFVKPESREIMLALNLYHASGNSGMLQTQRLIFCTLIETLSNYVIKSTKDEFRRIRDDIISHVDSLQISPGMKRPLLDGIRNIQLMPHANQLKAAADRLGVPITDEESDLWKKERNQVSHGKFKFTDTNNEDELNEDLRVRAQLANIINKMFLGLFDYSGLYVDFGESGWPVKEFARSRVALGTLFGTTD